MEVPTQRSSASKRRKLAHGDSNAARPTVEAPGSDGQDAIERRRKQIRLAQRAYRERKEATITTLQDQVDALEKQLVIANKTIAELRASQGPANSCGAVPAQTEIPDRPVYCEDSSYDQAPLNTGQQPRRSPLRLEYRDDWLSQPTYQPRAVELHHTAPGGDKIVELPMGIIEVQQRKVNRASNLNQQPEGYSTTHAERVRSGQTIHWLSTLARSVESGPSPAEDTTSDGNISTDAEVIQQKTTPETSVSPSVVPKAIDFDYASRIGSSIHFSNESRFVRRLHRQALKWGLHLLENWETHLEAFHRVFRIPLLYNTREYITHRFRTALIRGPNNTGLNLFVMPFIHLGGAGLHYSSRKIRHACLVRAVVGEPGKARMQSTEGPGLTYEVDLDLQQYEGDWYNTDDVEGFLRERGVHGDDDQRFVHAEVRPEDLSNLSRSNTVTPGGRDLSSQSTPINPSPVDLQNELDTAAGLDDWSSLNNLDHSEANQGPTKSSSYGFNSVFLFPTPATMKQFSPSFTTPLGAPKRRKAMLDLTKMMNELMEHGICLGRAPGFRKIDVERAFSRAIVSV